MQIQTSVRHNSHLNLAKVKKLDVHKRWQAHTREARCSLLVERESSTTLQKPRSRDPWPDGAATFRESHSRRITPRESPLGNHARGQELHRCPSRRRSSGTGLPGGPVAKNLPSSARDMGLTPVRELILGKPRLKTPQVTNCQD